MSYDAVKQAIVSAIKSTKGLGKEYDVKPYIDEGWLEYMFDHGTEGLLVEVISPAKH